MNTTESLPETVDEQPEVDEKSVPANRAAHRGARRRGGAARTVGRRPARNERQLIELRYGPSAREWFALLRQEVLDARPIIGKWADGTPRYGRSTYRNRVDGGRG